VADDLIPPPSPAGRPPPDPAPLRLPPGPADDRGGGGLWAGAATPESAAGTRLPAPEPSPDADAGAGEPPLPPSPYRPRFGFLAGALAGIAIATIALSAILIGGLGSGAPSGWSEWRPSSSEGVTIAREVAEHVGPKYRQADGDQLVLVEAGPLEVSNPPVPLAGVAVRTAPQGGDIELIEGKGVMFTLNGLGSRGSIAEGPASKERHRLLRREALELALYTFRYAEDVDLVVTLLPPGPETVRAGATPVQTAMPRQQALLFRPGDLRRQLEAPLTRTIPARTPRPETIPGDEARAIDRLTLPNLFLADFRQGQNLRAYLVLERFS